MPSEPIEEDYEHYEDSLEKYEAAMVEYKVELAEYEKVMSEYQVIKDAWLEDNKLSNIVTDGSKKRNRFHQGFIAQEVMELNTGFGGVQDHKINGGDDVLSLGYDEFIPPLVKAIQELTERVKELENKL
jgi:hypothetical protein